MNQETIRTAVDQLNEETRLRREEARRQEAARRDTERRIGTAVEHAEAVMSRFHDFVVTTAPHDHNEPEPDEYTHAHRVWATARGKEAETKVVIGAYETNECGLGHVVATVKPYGRPRAEHTPSRYSDLDTGHVRSYSVELTFRYAVNDRVMDQPLTGTERYSLNDIEDRRYGRQGEPDADVSSFEAFVDNMRTNATETLAVLEAAARNPELNPELAARFAERAPLPAAE